MQPEARATAATGAAVAGLRACASLLACALAVALAGCSGLGALGGERARAAEPVAAPDREQLQSQAMAFYIELLHRFAKAGPAEQAELFANIRRDYDSAPTPSSQLHFALAVATPNHPSTDPVLAQKLLRQLLSAPQMLSPVEYATAYLELQKVDRQLALVAENARLQSEIERGERERAAALGRRLQAETEDNARLRKALEDAQAKLAAIANIERETTARRPAPSPGTKPGP